jgi:hypothetical protein
MHGGADSSESALPPTVVICTPTRAKPRPEFLAALEASVPVLEAAGWNHAAVYEVGSPYISHARSKMLHKALRADATAIVFIDDDVSWQPDAILRMLEVKEPVVAGTYRFKREPEEYMGSYMAHDGGGPIAKMQDGQALVEMFSVPAGFLRLTREAVNTFMRAFPELVYGEPCSPFIDLFNHGAWNGTWYGEDYAFCRRWREKCGRIWCLPDLQIDHHGDKPYPGNYDARLRKG